MEAATHPIGLYLKVWLLLFVLSTFSYLVDFFHVAGYLRWMLILLLMVAKAGLIVAVFMHLRWERAALIYVVLAPPACLLVLAWLMWLESGYTCFTRLLYFR